MKTEIKNYHYPNGELQRVEAVYLEDWNRLDFLELQYDDASLQCFYEIYKNYLIPACPWIFGRMMMFYLPEDVEIAPSLCNKKYGMVTDRLTIASIILEEGVKIQNGAPVFRTEEAKHLWSLLEERDAIRIVCGKLPVTKVIPIGKRTGFLSKEECSAAMKVNANFFIMDPIDCATIYDQVGTPFGLCIKNGVIKNPPLFGREALLVSADHTVSIQEVDVRKLKIEIEGTVYCHGKNAKIYTRPECRKTPSDTSTKIVIIGTKVVAVKHGGSVCVPASGFVLCVDTQVEPIGAKVTYRGMEDVVFGIQVGNSIIRDGQKTMQFVSKFYNIYHLEKIPFPPSLYPMNFEKARAARIAIGADKEGNPVLFWAEGAGKLQYKIGEDSCGASLLEMAEIAADLGLHQAVNLDGGGSAQILINNKRSLLISDRNKVDNTEAERLIPMALMIK